ncbi:MAG: Tetratricopeptide repeat-containing protein [Haloplasmataceae bacterium]|jgi:tetratricopeptide (TPR) repeat protein|nr:Tetratricopeptide repeat-containing protein [Haloplasmataceae bacterium]
MNNTSKIFLGLIVFCICSVFFVRFEGKEQDKVFKKNIDRFSQAKDNISNDPKLAISQFTELQKILIDDPYFYKDLGAAYVLQGDYVSAIGKFRIAIEKYPPIIRDGQFDLLFGGAAFYSKDYLLAKLLLDQAIKVGVPNDSFETLDYLLSETNEKVEKANE